MPQARALRFGRTRWIGVLGSVLPLIATLVSFSPALAAPGPAGVLGTNLIVNAGAEAGPGSPSSVGGVVAVPGWQTSGNFTVVEYETQPGVPDSFPTFDDVIPAAHGTNLFAGGPDNASSSASQTVSLAAAAKLIDAGLLRYSLSGWLGGFAGQDDHATLNVSFRRANGQEVGSAVIGPVDANHRDALTGFRPRAAFGAVPAGTRHALIVLEMTKEPGVGAYNDGYADDLSLVLTSLIGSNIVVNPGAELGRSSTTGFDVFEIPGWSTTPNFTVARYGGEGLPSFSDAGPASRGTALFAGGPDTSFSTAEQTIDVSAARRLIDTGIVRFALSGFLGGFVNQEDAARVVVEFHSPEGVLAEAPIGPVTAADRGDATGLLERSTEGAVPAGTRWVVVRIEATRDPEVGTYDDGYADELRLVLFP